MIKPIRPQKGLLSDGSPSPFQALAHNDAHPYDIGTVIESRHQFRITDAQLSVHMAVLGGSGSGKSKFLELVLRQRLLDGKAFGLWDPHGDLTKALAAFVAAHTANGNDALWRKVHYLELTPECIFSFDPVARAPRRKEVGDYAYYQWLHVRVERVWKVIMRRVDEHNQDVMVRLKRWMRCILYACLVAIDDQNTHVGLDKALLFTDPKNPRFDAVYRQVEEHLPERVRRNFEKLIETRRAQDQERWVESTINKLEEALSPLTEAVYSQLKPSIDIKGIIDRGEFLLINLKETEYFSGEEKVVLGGLLLSEVLSAKGAEEDVPEEQRKEFMIVVDEVGELLGDDLQHALGATRKFKCPIVLGAQDLSTFTRGDLDMSAKVLTMCGTVVCFQNTFKSDKEILADRVFMGNMDLFTKRIIEVQRQRGDRVLRYDEFSENVSQSSNWSTSRSEMEGESHARMLGEALALGNHFSESEQRSEGVSKRKHEPRAGNEVISRTGGSGKASGESEVRTSNSGIQDGTSRSVTEATSNGGANQYGINIAHKIVVQPNIVSEFEEDGSLEHGTPELQRAQNEQRIHLLGVGQAAFAIRGNAKAVIVQVLSVEEWFTDSATKYEAIRRLKKRLVALHPYYVDPRSIPVARPEITVPAAAPAPSTSRPSRLQTEAPVGVESPFDDEN